MSRFITLEERLIIDRLFVLCRVTVIAYSPLGRGNTFYSPLLIYNLTYTSLGFLTNKIKSSDLSASDYRHRFPWFHPEVPTLLPPSLKVLI